MKKKDILAVNIYSKLFSSIILLVLTFSAVLINAQSTITTVYGDEGGFFTSSTGTVNSYNDSNNLLGFRVGGVTYSTGVNDATLTSNAVTFTTGKYFALPIPGSITYNSTSLVGIAANWGGVAQTNAPGDFIKTFSPIVPSFFVRDGNAGLELGTNFFNIRSQVITYGAIVINQAVSINDAKPDILVTQTGAPGATDRFKFIDSGGLTVGSELNVVFSGVSRVGITRWSIYRVNLAGAVTSAFAIDSPRDLRMISFKLSDFGITLGNYDDIVNFVHTTSGNTDLAFTAYNVDAVEISLPDTELEVSSSSVSSDNTCAPTTTSFVTTITNNSAELSRDFEVELDLPAGVTSTTSSKSFTEGGIPSSFASYNTGDDKWTVQELSAGESVTLTVNATVGGGVTLPITFTATADLLYQDDTTPGNNAQTVNEVGTDNDCDGVLDGPDLDDDNDGILDSVEGVGDDDGDGIPNHHDLDSDGDGCPDALEGGGTVLLSDLNADFVIVNGTIDPVDGVPELAAAGSGAGQALGDSQDDLTRTCDTTDTDGDGYIDIVDLDDDNDGILDTDEPGNTGAGAVDRLNTDSDGDGCPDAIEGGASFTYSDIDVNERLTGGVDANGIPTAATASGQTIGDSQNGGVQSADCSLAPVIISQIYQTAGGNAIELTNIGAVTVSNIRLALFKDIGAGSPSGVVPSASVVVASLTAGSSVIIKSIATLPGVTIINAPTEVLNASVADIADGDDTLIISTTTDNTAWANRYDVASNISDETSLVRIDNTDEANTTFTSSEWISFIDDAVAVFGDNNPIISPNRHANAPLLSEVETPNAQANIGLGLHRVNSTIRTGGAWSNGFPDKSRNVIIQQTYTHSGSSLNARILDVQGSNVLNISNNALIVLNNTNINSTAEIRILGSGQFIQVHDGTSQVTGSGKLLISQRSELPNTYRYNYWSSPVVESAGGTTYRVSEILKDAVGNLSAISTVSNINFVSGYDGAAGSPIQISKYWIWAFFNNTDRDDWVQIEELSYLNRGLGFTMKSTGVNPQYFTFKGSPTDGDISFTVSGSTTSLMGNPYAGTLDAHAFILNNEGALDGTISLWEHTGEASTVAPDAGHAKFGYRGGYATITLGAKTVAVGLAGTDGLGTPTKTPTRYIAAAQGFFASSDADGGTVVFNNKMRSFQATPPTFFKGTNKESKKLVNSNVLPILKLGFNFVNENGLLLHRQVAMSFNEEHSFGPDYGYEAEMIDVQPTDIFINLKEIQDKKLVIAGLEGINDNLQIPITVIVDSENLVSFKIDEKENFTNPVYLFDALEKTSTELKTDELLELQLPKGTYSDRFFIVFNENTILGINNVVSEIDLKIYMNNDTKMMTIQNKTDLSINEIEVFNILGQKIKTWQLKEQHKTMEIYAGNVATSIYIVKVKTDKGIVTKKLLKE